MTAPSSCAPAGAGASAAAKRRAGVARHAGVARRAAKSLVVDLHCRCKTPAVEPLAAPHCALEREPMDRFSNDRTLRGGNAAPLLGIRPASSGRAPSR